MSSKTRKNKTPRLPLNSDFSKYVALDCEMVGVGPGGRESVLGEVSILDWEGNSLYHSYVTPPKDKPVTDYREKYSGLTKELVDSGKPFLKVQKEVRNILQDKIVVGHALDNDFRALKLPYKPENTRNTAYHPFFQQEQGMRVEPNGTLVPILKPRKLQKLAKQYLGRNIQMGEHDPTEDAKAALDIFKDYRLLFEPSPNMLEHTLKSLAALSIANTGSKTRRRKRQTRRRR